MNEITIQSQNLPSNIEDLSRFVLIGREKLNAVRAAIRAIEKVGTAKEVAEQKRKEAQALAEAVIDAEVRIGELMREIPTAAGTRTDIEPRLPGETRLRTKEEVLEDNGFTRNQGNKFERMSKHPKAVAEAKAEARENDEIVTRSAVLDKIKEEKKRLEEENAELRKIVVELKDREPEVQVQRVEVPPSDYRTLRSKAAAYDADIRAAEAKVRNANAGRQAAEERALKLQQEIEELRSQTASGQFQNNVIDSAVYFSAECAGFLKAVGGYAWLKDHLDEIPERERGQFIKAIRAIYQWAGVMLTNIEGSTDG